MGWGFIVTEESLHSQTNAELPEGATVPIAFDVFHEKSVDIQRLQFEKDYCEVITRERKEE